jgi:hypothetical protein
MSSAIRYLLRQELDLYDGAIITLEHNRASLTAKSGISAQIDCTLKYHLETVCAR